MIEKNEKVFEYEGKWWLPESPEDKIDGKLKIFSDYDLLLQLDSNFKHIGGFSGSPITPEIILGETANGDKITLWQCLGINGTITSSGDLIFVFAPMRCYIGVHFNEVSQIKFKTISFRCSYLDHWLGISGFRLNDPLKELQEKKIIIEYKWPDQIIADIGDGLTIKINFIVSLPRRDVTILEATISQKAEIIIESDKEKSYDYFERIIYNIVIFLCLATTESVEILEISGETEASRKVFEGRDYYSEVKIINKKSAPTQEKKGIDRLSMLFSYCNIANKFTTIIKNWLSNAESLQNVYQLYYRLFRHPAIHLEQDFLSLVQALEIFHRYKATSSEQHYINDHEYQEKICKPMINAISTEIDQNLKDRLEHYLSWGNEYSLRDRLKSLIKEKKDILSHFQDYDKKFVQQVVDTRNKLVHYSVKDNRMANDYAEKLKLYYKVKILLEISLLQLTGFESCQIVELYRRKWAWLRTIIGINKND